MKLSLKAKIKRIASAESDAMTDAFEDYFKQDQRFTLISDPPDNNWIAYIPNCVTNYRQIIQELNGTIFKHGPLQRQSLGLLEENLEIELREKIAEFNQGDLSVLPQIADLFFELRKPITSKEYLVGEEWVRLEESDLNELKHFYRLNHYLDNTTARFTVKVTTKPELIFRRYFKNEQLKQDLNLKEDVWIGIL